MNIVNVNTQPIIQTLNNTAQTGNANNTFDSFFSAYMDILNEASGYEKTAEQLQLDFATGKTDDMLAVTLAQEKAYASLNFTVQVTNKIIEAYREIMRISL